MAFCHTQWYSEALGKPVEMNLILPEQGEPPFPVLYLLHGLYGGAMDWYRNTRLESYVQAYPLVIVMPDGFRSFYARMQEGPDYHAYMAEELPGYLERQFHVRRDRGGRSIGGLSMGGYGAMRLALTHPDRYCAVASHSGAVTIGTWPEQVEALDRVELRRIFGPSPEGSEHDLLHLARGLAETDDVPAIWLDSGTEDAIPLEQGRLMHEHLTGLGIAHQYFEHPGEHNWDYWDRQIQEALPWHAEQLGIAAVTA